MAFIITGTGRCGTKLLSKLLTATGIPCGHESVFNHSLVSPPKDLGELHADSSWMALPFLDRVDMPVVTLTRHPLQTVKSFVDIGFFGKDADNPCHSVVRDFAPDVYKYSHQHDRALAHWMVWTETLIQFSELRFRIEEFNADKFCRLIQWTGLSAREPVRIFRSRTRANANPHRKLKEKYSEPYTPAWSSHHTRLRNRAIALARVVGYRD